MKKSLILLMLVLSLLVSVALAENAYVPGNITEKLFVDAFARGDMLTLDMQFHLEPSENTGAVFGEDAAMFAPVAQALENAIFSVGAGKIENGLRVTLEGEYADGEKNAEASAALDLTDTGLAVTSSLIPGERLTANWETLLALCGASEEEIASIMSLRDADLEALLAELTASLQPMLEMAAQIAAPYSETILAHIAGLPMVINENVPAENGYPAAAAEMQIQISTRAVGDLIIALAQQLKQDATLCAILDTVLAETAENGSAPTTAQVCDAVMQAAAEELTDETNPLNVFIGLDESGNLLYLSMFAENDDGTYFTINYIAGRLEDSDASLFNVDVLTLSAEQEIIDGFSCVLAYTVDEENPQVMSAEMVLGGYAEGTEILSFSFSLGQTEAILDGQTGYEGLFAMALGAFDGESTAVVSMDGSMTSCPTANNGEQLIIQGSMNVLADAEEIPMTFEGSVLTTVADGFPIATMTEAAFLPELGISEWREFYTLRAEPMTADEAMTETALESASPEDLEALAGRAMTNMEQTLTTLYELLPPELTENASAA